MHTRSSATVLAALFASLVATSALQASVSQDMRTAMTERLYQQIGRAGQSYRSRQQLAGAKERAVADLQVAEEAGRALLAEQAALRRERDVLRTVVRDLQGRGYDHAERFGALRLRQAAVVRLARTLHRDAVGKTPLLAALSAGTEARRVRLLAAAAREADLLQGGRSVFVSLLAVEARLSQSRQELLAVQENAETLKEEIARAEEGLTSVKAITKDVHDQVLLLQRALSRIDAQLRTRAERALLEKGLLSEVERRTHAAAPSLQWPVEGPVSAGFKNADYLAHFGVPHLGTDIAVTQGTIVRSALDGIVFLVRDGGEKGYTYVLVGHRDGYATLYGHLSVTSVVAGQRVSAGEEIGRSGGTPGTYGAGPMTSGAHLHFELIKDGANVDPLSVLPQR